MPSPSTPLSGALIGCGYFGRIQLQAWGRMPDVAIVAACDPQLDRARAAAQRAYAEPERMLDQERLDFVDIATRPESHLARLVEAFGVRVMVHENWRFRPWYREAKRRIDRGEIGQPVSYSFRMRQRDGLGPDAYPNQPYFRQMPRLLIYETLIHPIDTARFLRPRSQATCFSSSSSISDL